MENEESEGEVYNQLAINATTNRLRIDGNDRDRFLSCRIEDEVEDDESDNKEINETEEENNEDNDKNDDDNGEIDEKEEEENDGVFEEQSKNISNIEKNEKDKEVEENEGEKTCGKNNEQKKGNIDPCGECNKHVKQGVQCKICKIWRHWKTECSGLHKGYNTPKRVVESKFICQSCAKEITKAEVENNTTNKRKVFGRRNSIEKKPVRGRGRKPSVFDKTTILTGGTLPKGSKEGTTDPKRGKMRDREGTPDPKDKDDRSPRGKKAKLRILW